MAKTPSEIVQSRYVKRTYTRAGHAATSAQKRSTWNKSGKRS